MGRKLSECKFLSIVKLKIKLNFLLVMEEGKLEMKIYEYFY